MLSVAPTDVPDGIADARSPDSPTVPRGAVTGVEAVTSDPLLLHLRAPCRSRRSTHGSEGTQSPPCRGSACDHVGVGRRSGDQPKLRPGYSETSTTLHYVMTDGDGVPSGADDGAVRALCGAYITAVESQRSLLRAGGEPCVHCNTQFRKRGLGPA